MKLKGHLMMGLIGLAMIAAPITASAQNTDNHKYETTAPHAFSSPARENRTVRNVTPPTREERVNRTAPEVATHRDAKEVREDVNRWDANRGTIARFTTTTTATTDIAITVATTTARALKATT